MHIAFSSEFAIFALTFVYTIYSSITPQLVLQKVCLQNYNQSVCSNLPNYRNEQVIVQKDATWWIMKIFLSSSCLSFFSVLLLGPITDIIGRRIGFIYAITAMFLQNIVLLFCSIYIKSAPAYILFASILAGTYGDLQGIITLCYSHTADLTCLNINNRTKSMLLLESFAFFSIALAGLISGYLVKHASFKSVYVANTSILVFLFIYVLTMLKNNKQNMYYENLIDNSYSEAEASLHLQSSTSVIKPLAIIKRHYLSIKSNPHRYILLMLLFIYLCGVCFFAGDIFIIPIYLKNSPFNFNSQTIGYYIAVNNFCMGIGLIIIWRLSHYYNISDYVILTVGFVSQIIAYTLTGAARTKVVLFTVRLTGMFASVVNVTLRSQITKLVSSNQYGGILGAVVAVDVCGVIFINFIGLLIYHATIETYSGIVFFVIAGISFIGLYHLLCTWRKVKLLDREEEEAK